MFDDDAVDADVTAPRQTALVPLAAPWDSASAPLLRVRLDSGFVTQLIATAAHVPQTRTLCRASPQDAESSYRAAARRSQPQPAPRPTGTARVA